MKRLARDIAIYVLVGLALYALLTLAIGSPERFLEAL